MPAYLWFDQWTTYDRLSKICRDVKVVPRQKKHQTQVKN